MPKKKNDASQDHIRPTGIKILSILYLLTSLFHLLKVSQVIQHWNTLKQLPLAVPNIYLAGDGLVWFISGLVLAVGIWIGKSWSKPAAMVMSTLFCLAFWVDRIWIAEPEGLAQRWPVNLFLTFIGLGSIYLILNHQSSQAFFRENPAKIP